MSHDETGSVVKEERFKLGDRVKVMSVPHLFPEHLIGEEGYVTELHGLVADDIWYYLNVGGSRGSLPQRCLVPA